jgi:hypothetical protein
MVETISDVKSKSALTTWNMYRRQRTTLQQIVATHNLTDIYRNNYPQGKETTHLHKTHNREARLDKAYAPSHLNSHIEHLDDTLKFTDH